MRFAIPISNGRLCSHFGHCEKFAFIDTDTSARTITGRFEIDAPAHQPGFLPAWLAQHGVRVVIAGGMGSRAQGLFAGHGITTVIGAPADNPDDLVRHYLNGTLASGENICDH
jgi:predicted Fe-Mo cluster-binding NifX family protein